MQTRQTQFTVPLVVTGVDLDDEATLDVIGAHFDELTWEAEAGQVIAIVHTTSADPIAEAAHIARAITTTLPEAHVLGVDPQLVSLGDIADRVGISSEAVRLWAAGKRRASTPFPTPAGRVSTGRTVMKIWSWPDVLAWLREEYLLDPEPGITYLSAGQVHALGVELSSSGLATSAS